MRTFCVALILAVLVGCAPIVPATTPPQLRYTPAPSVMIEEEWVRDEAFEMRYPASWRVVKVNTAPEPTRLVFVSPSENDDPQESQIAITVSIAPIVPPQAAQGRVILLEEVTLASGTVWLMSEAPQIRENELKSVITQMKDSLSAP